MIDWLRRFLRNSKRLHVVEIPACDLRSCIGVIDRFIDGTPRYPLEWDDFISWESEFPEVEAVRRTIAPTERLFFSDDVRDEYRAMQLVVNERNRVAALIGEAARQAPPDNSLERSHDR